MDVSDLPRWWWVAVLLWLKLVDLLDVDGESSCCVELSRAVATLEVLRLLVLHQH